MTSVTEYVREALTRFVALYPSRDDGTRDPARPVREYAQELLEGQPTVDDLLTVAAEISAVLPNDPRAHALREIWYRELTALDQA